MLANRSLIVASACFGVAMCPTTWGAEAIDLPSVDQVIDSALKAVGGEDAVKGVKTLHAVFEMDFGGQKITSDTSWSRAGGRLAKMSMPGVVEAEMGTDGEVKWMKTAMGYSLMEGQQAEQFDGQVGMYAMVLEPRRLAKEDSKSIEVAGIESFAGKECYRLHYVDKSDKAGDVFFEVAGGLLAGVRSTNDTPRGAVASTIVMSDWKEERGVKFFRTVTTESQGAFAMPPMQMLVTTLEVNTLDETLFALPDDVKKLAEAQKPDEPTADEIKLSDLTPEQQKQATDMIDGIKRAGTAAPVKSAISSIEQAAKYAPPDQKKMYEYVVQELKKYAAKLEGGG